MIKLVEQKRSVFERLSGYVYVATVVKNVVTDVRVFSSGPERNSVTDRAGGALPESSLVGKDKQALADKGFTFRFSYTVYVDSKGREYHFFEDTEEYIHDDPENYIVLCDRVEILV